MSLFWRLFLAIYLLSGEDRNCPRSQSGGMEDRYVDRELAIERRRGGIGGGLWTGPVMCVGRRGHG